MADFYQCLNANCTNKNLVHSCADKGSMWWASVWKLASCSVQAFPEKQRCSVNGEKVQSCHAGGWEELQETFRTYQEQSKTKNMPRAILSKWNTGSAWCVLARKRRFVYLSLFLYFLYYLHVGDQSILLFCLLRRYVSVCMGELLCCWEELQTNEFRVLVGKQVGGLCRG